MDNEVKNEPPCDCIVKTESGWIQRCECMNSGDLADAQAWCTEQNAKARNEVKNEPVAFISHVTLKTLQSGKPVKAYPQPSSWLTQPLYAKPQSSDVFEALDEALTFVYAWSAHYRCELDLDDIHPTHQAVIDRIKAALAKARGENHA